ncbi:hypothetical protein ES703_107539 [subsurface metagenome]
MNRPTISTASMVPAVIRQVSAEDMTAPSSAARTKYPRKGGKTSFITVGKASSGEMPGNKADAPMPIRVMPRAKGIISAAAQKTDVRAVLTSRAQNKREYISGPTT